MPPLMAIGSIPTIVMRWRMYIGMTMKVTWSLGAYIRSSMTMSISIAVARAEYPAARMSASAISLVPERLAPE